MVSGSVGAVVACLAVVVVRSVLVVDDAELSTGGGAVASLAQAAISTTISITSAGKVRRLLSLIAFANRRSANM